MSFVLANKKINKVALSGDDDKRIILEDISNRRMIAFLDQRLQNEIGVFHFFFVNFTPLSQNLHFSTTYLDPASILFASEPSVSRRF